jgi:hypothetical protein
LDLKISNNWLQYFIHLQGYDMKNTHGSSNYTHIKCHEKNEKIHWWYPSNALGFTWP